MTYEEAASRAACSLERSRARRQVKAEGRVDRYVCGLLAVIVIAYAVAVGIWEPWL